MDNIFADRYRGLVARSARVPAVEEQVQKQHDRVPYRSGKDDYNPWPDINPNQTRRHHPTQADAVGFDIFINMDNKLSSDDLKIEENIVKQPEKEDWNYQWSEPHAQQKTVKHESAGPTCSDNVLQFSWGNRAMELRNQEKNVFTSDYVHKGKRSVDSTERKRKVDDYPKWSFEDPKDEAVQEKKKRKLNKRDSRGQKRKTKSKKHVGDSCSQCKRTGQMSMVDDEVFTHTCHWMLS